jgi:PTS system mannose-specific IIA component
VKHEPCETTIKADRVRVALPCWLVPGRGKADNQLFAFVNNARVSVHVASVLLIAHAPLASALLSVAGHCYAEQGHLFEAVDVEAGMTAETVEGLARAALARLDAPEVLVLTDVFGATPCNVAQSLANGGSVRVVAGVNVPMLWRSLCYLGEPLEALVARALAGASQGVMQVATTRPQNQSQTPPSNDPNNSSHQQ